MYSLNPIAVSFPLTPVDGVQGTGLVCLRKVGLMDTAKVVLAIRPEEINRYVTSGSTVQITWSNEVYQDEFYGYVHSLQPIVDGYTRKTVILAVSTAYPMYNGANRSFNRVGLHHIVSEIANDHRFNLDADSHPLVQEQILQYGESDWTFLHRLADRWGYLVIVDGVTIIFRRVEPYLEEQHPRATWDRIQALPSEVGTSLVSFAPEFSPLNEKSPMAISMGFGVDPATSQPLDWEEPGEGVFTKADTDRTVLSKFEGEMVERAEVAKARFPHVAHATVLSPFGKKPYDIYQISHEMQTMTWAVRSVKHKITDGRYTGDLVLRSDGQDHLRNRHRERLGVPFRTQRYESMQKASPVVVNTRPYYRGTGTTVLVKDQRWRSQVMNVRIAEGVS